MALKNKTSQTSYNRMIIVKFLSLLMVVFLLLASFTACKTEDKTTPTNEELIEERIKTFLTAYNSGDMETVLECLDAKTRNAFQAMLNLLGGIAGSYAGFDIDLSDLFSLGVNTTSGDFMGLEIISINIIDDTNAVATTIMDLSGTSMHIYFDMVYENDGWYISDMTDKKIGNANSDSTPTDENTISPTWRDAFVDGVAGISYTENGVEYLGIINTNGEIIYSTDKSVRFTAIGKGATVVSEYNQESYEYNPAYILDGKGDVVATFENEVQLLAYGDGLALIYQQKDTITTIEHLYGVIDFSGKWVQSLTDLGYYPQSGWDYSHYYVGDGVFAIMVQSWAGSGGDDFIFLNSNTGDMFYISRLRRQLSQFVNGITFVYGSDDWSDIINPYHKADEAKGVEAPAYYLLYNNGTYEEYSMDGKDFGGYSNGYLWYTVDGDENNVYIENISSSNKNTFTYSEYPASMIYSISFNGDYGLVTIKGANGNLCFTLIDKNGNQQFDPIETTSYSSFSGTHWVVFADETIIFENTDKKYCIANKNGEIIVTDYAYIGAFSNNMAIACIGDSQYDDDAIWVYINQKNEQIMPTIKKP